MHGSMLTRENATNKIKNNIKLGYIKTAHIELKNIKQYILKIP
jgi:hypothetical protein